jgi:hypothetical protein
MKESRQHMPSTTLQKAYAKNMFNIKNYECYLSGGWTSAMQNWLPISNKMLHFSEKKLELFGQSTQDLEKWGE